VALQPKQFRDVQEPPTELTALTDIDFVLLSDTLEVWMFNDKVFSKICSHLAKAINNAGGTETENMSNIGFITEHTKFYVILYR
jgi:hypothetical protein